MDVHKLFATSLVATAPSPATSGTSLVVTAADGALFPAPTTDGSFYVTVCPAGTQPSLSNAEVLRVSARSTDTFTIARAQLGTTARSITVGDQVFQALMPPDVEDPGNAYQSRPSDHGFVGWTGHPYEAHQVFTAVAGVAIYARVYLPKRVTIASVVSVHTTNATVASNAYFGVFDSSGTRVGLSADRATALQSSSPIGGLVNTLTQDSGQTLVQGGGAGAYVWVGFVLGAASTKPIFRALSSTSYVTNFGFASAPYLAGTIGSGLTALPTSITPSAMALTAGPFLLGLA